MKKIEQFKIHLSQAMKDKSINQKDVERLTGVPQTSISYFLNGKRPGLSGDSVLNLVNLIYGVELKYPEHKDADRIS